MGNGQYEIVRILDKKPVQLPLEYDSEHALRMFDSLGFGSGMSKHRIRVIF